MNGNPAVVPLDGQGLRTDDLAAGGEMGPRQTTGEDDEVN